MDIIGFGFVAYYFVHYVNLLNIIIHYLFFLFHVLVLNTAYRLINSFEHKGY